ncbi:MAG: hypothetical protein IKS37_07110 [Solobacterium sp.]|nr:hypothetical protein [Solobacterium sp.]
MAFYSNDIQELTDKGLVCKRAAGNTYTINDDRFVLEFYYDHRNDDAKTLTHAVMKDERMWGMDLTTVEGFEEAAAQALQQIRDNGVLSVYADAVKGEANA